MQSHTVTEIALLENTGVNQLENVKSGPNRWRNSRLARERSAAEKILADPPYQAEPDLSLEKAVFNNLKATRPLGLKFGARAIRILFAI